MPSSGIKLGPADSQSDVLTTAPLRYWDAVCPIIILSWLLTYFLAATQSYSVCPHFIIIIVPRHLSQDYYDDDITELQRNPCLPITHNNNNNNNNNNIIQLQGIKHNAPHHKLRQKMESHYMRLESVISGGGRPLNERLEIITSTKRHHWTLRKESNLNTRAKGKGSLWHEPQTSIQVLQFLPRQTSWQWENIMCYSR